MDSIRNFGKVDVSGTYNSSDNVITLTTSNINMLPESGSGYFNAVWYNSTDYPSAMDDPNKEIIRSTGMLGSNSILVIRGYEGPNASSKNTASKTYKLNTLLAASSFNQSYYIANPRSTYYYYTDFLTPVNTGGTTGAVWKFISNSGSANNTGDIGRPGIVTLEVPKQSGLYHFGVYGSGTFDFAASGNYIYETSIKLDALPTSSNNFSNKFGICDNIDNNDIINNGFSISYDQNGAFTATVATTGARVSGSIPGISTSTGWTKFKVTYNANGNTVFYVNDMSGLSLEKPSNNSSSLGSLAYNIYRTN